MEKMTKNISACVSALTHFVFRIFQVEHEGPVFVLVLAVGAKAEVEHFLFNGNCQPSHLTLCHFQIITVAHPGSNQHEHWCLGLKVFIQTSTASFLGRQQKSILTSVYKTPTSYTRCPSVNGECSVSSGCWAVAA